VDAQDIQQWIVQLLGRYSGAYASIQFRALRQFFKWRAGEDECPDPMARLRAPKVTVTAVPVFTSVELSDLNKACQGRSFPARRDAAIIAVFTATDRLAELAGLCYDPGDPRHSDIDLWQREITVRGKGGKDRIVKIGHQTARSLDRYLRARARHAQAWRNQLWLGAGNREPLTAAGIYQMAARRGGQCGVDVYPHRCRHLQPHLARPRRARGRPDRTQRLDLPADAPPLRRQRPQRPRPPHLRPHHNRHLTTPAQPGGGPAHVPDSPGHRRHPSADCRRAGCPGLLVQVRSLTTPGIRPRKPALQQAPGRSRPGAPISNEDGSPGSRLRVNLAGLAGRLPLGGESPGLWVPGYVGLRKPSVCPTKIPQVRVPGRPHKFPTDTTTHPGTPRHSC
jgi:hypothetical protein